MEQSTEKQVTIFDEAFMRDVWAAVPVGAMPLRPKVKDSDQVDADDCR